MNDFDAAFMPQVCGILGEEASETLGRPIAGFAAAPSAEVNMGKAPALYHSSRFGIKDLGSCGSPMEQDRVQAFRHRW